MALKNIEPLIQWYEENWLPSPPSPNNVESLENGGKLDLFGNQMLEVANQEKLVALSRILNNN